MGGYGNDLGMSRLAEIPLMGTSPLPAMGQALNLAGLLQGQQENRALFPGVQALQNQRVQAGQMALDQAAQQQQQAQQDSAEFQRLFQDSNGDPEKIRQGLYSQNYNLSWKARAQADAELQQTQMGYAKLSEAKRNRALQDEDLMRDSLEAVKSAPPEKQAEVYAAQIPHLIAAGVDGADQLPKQFQGMDWLDTQERALNFHGANLKATTLKPGETAGMLNQDTGQFTPSYTAPSDKTPNVESLELADYLRRNPGKGASDFAAYKARLSRDPNAASDRQFREGQQSYQYSSGALDRVGAPIEALVQRMGRLQDTLAQANPQADALVAPEVLSVMAGGQGSGLRMNEAEISRIVGGRNNWESLKSAIGKWQTDPSQPFLITPAQRGQIGALLNEVNSKLQAKQQILDDARQDLSNSNDPMQHRQILTRARNKLMQVDQGQGGGGGLSSAAQAFINKYSR